ncbi:MAG TPA: TMEM175 family protein [Steroidobacteraceae bacterium]|nr:TMEM175 family protein [Steroidobacteraceae bacterium]
MKTTRLEAFSDGVIAILITIMVLELKVPHAPTWEALVPQLPVFLTYVLSFIYVGIYWNNHHHMFHLVERVSGGILWANLHLLFWLSLVPFATGWMGENHFAALPTAMYGCVLLAAALAYLLLQCAIVRRPEAGARLAVALGSDLKGKISLVAYAIAIPCAFVQQWISDALYVAVAALWLIPDRRIESVLGRE